MNQVISILGLEMPGFKAKDVVMRSQKMLVITRLLDHRDSLILLKGNNNNGVVGKRGGLEQDDDTASTMSGSDSDISFSSSDPCVTFAEPLVTEVRTRPYTTQQEKTVMFYNEHDYLDFKIEAYGGKPRNRKVKFAFDIVSDERVFEPCQDSNKLYYTEAELQGFLNEFIATLNDHVH
mmetsp:Transcript_20512/g.29661  ORF Transcript_20512/g.29661 Transcript_20512/m.29661 type:complete len:178 (-) Transcript_20512:323-856(-)